MNSFAFYGLLISSIVTSFLVGSTLNYISNGGLSIPIIFIFILLFPLIWKLGKKYFPRDDQKKWNSVKRIFMISVISYNLILTLLIIILLILDNNRNSNEIQPTNNASYEKYFPKNQTNSNEDQKDSNEDQKDSIDFAEF